MASNEIAVRETPQVDSWAAVMPDVVNLSKHLMDTEFVPAALRNRPAAIAAAILAGREAGVPPMRALSHMHIVDGRPSMSAEQKRALALAAGHEIVYEETTTQRCIVKGRRAGREQWSTVTWTMDDAKAAKLDGKDNWRKWPRRMLQARATGELCDMLFPDATAGLATYEELVDDTDAAGITSNGQEAPKKRTARRQTAVQEQPATHQVAENVTATNPNVPLPPLPGEEGYDEITEITPAEKPQASKSRGRSESHGLSPEQRTKVLALFNRIGVKDRNERLQLSAGIINREIGSANEMTKDEASALIDTLERISREEDPRAALGDLLAANAQQLIEDTFDAELVEE